uniref:G_PROTEIN_RECEP_F1_2 domain-containing protein n=1 Tax=Macrostomum lignano TaxID=282301 RepID=A0A1I8F9N4_9PLAT
LIDAMPLQARFIKGFNNQTQNWTDLDAQLLSGLQISPAQALIASLLALLACLTIFGNSLVILAVLRDHHLRTITNYFIVSLATADLLMGLVVVPFSAVSYATSDRWLFGPVWCDLWHAFDVLSTTASILNLCIIAMERYWAVENPISYPSRLTRRRCLMLVSAAWILASFISFPAIYWWRATAEATAPGEAYECRFTSDPVYLICSSVVSFYAPLLVMVFVYCKIYRTATQLVRGWHTGAKRLPWANGGGGDGANGGRRSSAIVLRIHRGRRELTPTEAATAAAAAAKEQHSSLGLRRKLARFSREQRAAKTLGVVMGVFIACWLPFFVCNVAVAVAPEALGRGGRAFGQVATWLGYANSCINPAIYAHSMRDFRRAFIRLLGCQRRSRQAAAAAAGVPLVAAAAAATLTTSTNRLNNNRPLHTFGGSRRRRERQARHGQMLKADSSFVRRGQRAASLTAAGPLRLASAAGAEEAAQQRPPSPIYACSSSTPMLHSAGAKDLISLSQLTQSGTRASRVTINSF